MSDQNLASLREIDEEDQVGELPPEEISESDDISNKRVSFAVLTSGISPPSRPRVSSSISGGTSSSRFIRFSSFSDRFSGRRDSELSEHEVPANIDSGNPQGLNRTLSSAVAARLGRFSSSTGLEPQVQASDTSRAYRRRRYRVGDPCLVSNHQSRFANLVNRYGFPPGQGVTPEEQRGPYVYVLATVVKVHFEEDAEYYTVKRADTGVDQRADDEWMEPLRTARGEAAARFAATEAAKGSTDHLDLDQSGDLVRSSRGSLYFITLPFAWIFNCTYHIFLGRLYQWFELGLLIAQKNGRLFLNGMMPYSWSTKITMVNFLVLCSIWYMFIDQVRLAFFPSTADHTLAIVDFCVWLVLVVELALETFIRPDGYYVLLRSEKAYYPSTARFINNFHLGGEIVSLIFFSPDFTCLFSRYSCGVRTPFSYFNAAFTAVLGPTRLKVVFGRLYIAVLRLRVFGMVRHWRNMWIRSTFVTMKSTRVISYFMPGKSPKLDAMGNRTQPEPKDSQEEDLTNVSNIGTALMVINSHRALMLLWAIVGGLPLIGTIATNGGANVVAPNMVSQLQANNLQFRSFQDNDECEFFSQTLQAWVSGVTAGGQASADGSSGNPYLMYLWIGPERCMDQFPDPNATITSFACDNLNNRSADFNPEEQSSVKNVCRVWGDTYRNTTNEELASRAGIRVGEIEDVSTSVLGNLMLPNGTRVITNYTVIAKFDQAGTVAAVSIASFLLQLSLLVCVLGGLSVLRGDAIVLVLGPLRRMLKIVARYAKNPLGPADISQKGDDSDEEPETRRKSRREDELGSFETTQLINAITKIADLLRKCWGVAGAGIISTNLATQEGALTEVFNPTVPGKSVYALFGFAAIGGFDHIIKNLGGEVMILINDVAAVLHGEVFRWGFGDSGQCNKNLGGAFLMVYRIGLVKEVIKKLEQATDVVFAGSTQKEGVRRRRKAKPVAQSLSSLAMASRRQTSRRRSTSTEAMGLSLQSLPGISAFTDRAVIGMLKSYAGIYRDHKLLAWKEDFRLGAGVGAFSVNMIFGMDAGWAVEGAVGSEYKIDATYLSPHVNMASRMMSACKQYGVSILLSQAVQKLMTSTARTKLRHLDTVTVKGSTLQQKIYTYDARHKGVDFFLFERSDDQADQDAERYSPSIWNTDQDLKAMRQHVTEDFEDEFRKGRDLYLQGKWSEAIKYLERANEIMVENVMDQGYIEGELAEIVMEGEERAEDELWNETGDGACQCLINFMKSKGRKPPDGWKGYRPLLQK